MSSASRPTETPVALFAFNRPAQTARVFEAIRAARPSHLLLVADGPRPDRPEDAGRCAEVRGILDGVDWPCTVERDFAPANLGCRRRVSSGIDWVFSRVPEAILLEDDCLPDPTFFPFCEELLARYRDDERVLMISGDDFRPGPPRPGASYRFSGYAHVWGWASWARAWRHYDVAMADWPEVRDGGGLTDLGDGFTEGYWRHIFDRTHAGEIQTWDYQWLYACLRRGLCVVPEGNLVTNIGFGEGAAHHAEANHLANLPTVPMTFPLRHPDRVERDRAADREAFGRVFSPIPSLRNRLGRRLRGIGDRIARLAEGAA